MGQNFARVLMVQSEVVQLRRTTPSDVAKFRPIRGRKIISNSHRINILSGPALRAAPAKMSTFQIVAQFWLRVGSNFQCSQIQIIIYIILFEGRVKKSQLASRIQVAKIGTNLRFMIMIILLLSAIFCIVWQRFYSQIQIQLSKYFC